MQGSGIRAQVSGRKTKEVKVQETKEQESG
jgi:hypothetical protein